jgi:hypothetical protein
MQVTRDCVQRSGPMCKLPDLSASGWGLCGSDWGLCASGWGLLKIQDEKITYATIMVTPTTFRKELLPPSPG